MRAWSGNTVSTKRHGSRWPEIQAMQTKNTADTYAICRPTDRWTHARIVEAIQMQNAQSVRSNEFLEISTSIDCLSQLEGEVYPTADK